ncbi:MBL fold metallo-hydrolase [Dysgonomonas sp. ZJ279]|uniref:MBL fold metallo-hydrolase n=1 Tax=Dysgonomonas sp. ZJ279 TaxID=2709796 RepID=UPI0013EA9867|nr:MBL fold metallo-hydrolase [Dysgonomonas sp. ZJ279]
MKRNLFLITTLLSLSLLACGSKSTSTEDSNKNAVDSLNTKQSSSYINSDIYLDSNNKPLEVTLVGHGSVMFQFDGKVIQVDPYSSVADYSRLPKADLILLTHEHKDHLDSAAIAQTKKADTHFIVSKVCNEILGYGDIMSNGNKIEWNGIAIEAVPAYNIVNKKPDGEHWHPKGRGNGYVLTFGTLKVYVAADTENIQEMNRLKGTIDIAFLPKNLPYTMSDEMFIDAAKTVAPKNLYPYHFSEFDEAKIGAALKDTGIKLVVKPMSNK